MCLASPWWSVPHSGQLSAHNRSPFGVPGTGLGSQAFPARRDGGPSCQPGSSSFARTSQSTVCWRAASSLPEKGLAGPFAGSFGATDPISDGKCSIPSRPRRLSQPFRAASDRFCFLDRPSIFSAAFTLARLMSGHASPPLC